MHGKQITGHIALTPHFERFVQAKVVSGRYRSASEVVGERLRLLEERDLEMTRARLQHDIEHGWEQLEAGDVVDGPAVFAEIRRMSKARRARKRAR